VYVRKRRGREEQRIEAGASLPLLAIKQQYAAVFCSCPFSMHPPAARRQGIPRESSGSFSGDDCPQTLTALSPFIKQAPLKYNLQ